MTYLITPELELAHNDRRKLLQDVPRPRRELSAWLVVDETQAAEVEAVRGTQRGAGIEAHSRLANHMRVLRKAPVLLRVEHHKRLVAVDEQRVPAKARDARRLCAAKARLRLVPLHIRVDKGEEDEAGVEHELRQVHNTVKVDVAGRVQNVEVVQRLAPFGFSRRHGRREEAVLFKERAELVRVVDERVRRGRGYWDRGCRLFNVVRRRRRTSKVVFCGMLNAPRKRCRRCRNVVPRRPTLAGREVRSDKRRPTACSCERLVRRRHGRWRVHVQRCRGRRRTSLVAR